MKKLLIITGDLATGKSTFSRVLSERYGIPAFRKDTIKERLGDTIGFCDRTQNKKLSVAAVAVMAEIFTELRGSGQDLILEANFRTDELERLHALADESGYAVMTLCLNAAMDVLYERYLHRMTDEHRHPVHLSAPLHVREEFDRYILTLREEHIPGERIGIDATDFSYQTDGTLLGQIDAFMGR